MNKTTTIALAALTLSLAACGGGGGAGPSVGTNVQISPTDQRNASLTDLRVSEGFAGYKGRIRYEVSASGSARNFDGTVPLVSNIAAVRYDAAAQSYTVTGDGLTTPSFGPAQRISGNATLTNSDRAGTTQQNLTLFNPGAANPRLALTYASFGAYQEIGTATNGSRTVDTTFFSYGVRTTAADMPRTGRASYDTIVDGQFADSTGVYALGGQSSFEADFGASTVTAGMTLQGQNVIDGRGKSFSPMALTGTIRSDTNGFSFSASGDGATMGGMFYGPGAAEIAGVFGFRTGDGAGTGAIAGRKR